MVGLNDIPNLLVDDNLRFGLELPRSRFGKIGFWLFLYTDNVLNDNDIRTLVNERNKIALRNIFCRRQW